MKKSYPKILAVDFDGTLCTTGFPRAGEQLFIHKKIAFFVKFLRRRGWFVILYTLREGRNLDTALEFCREHHIPIDLVNENEPRRCKAYADSNPRKIAYDLLIDDMTFSFLGFMLRMTDRFWRWRNK